MASLATLNSLAPADAEEELRRCCGSARWAAAVAGARPFGTVADLLAAGERAFDTLTRNDWLEAFSHHPRIGERAADQPRLAATAAWSAGEQSSMAGAPDGLRRRLAEANAAYERRFGHVFLIRAAGRSPAEMLGALERRLANDPRTELGIAAAEQRQITRLRLERLVSELSPVTTHVLDTSIGLPAAGVEVSLERREADGAWVRLVTGATDRDGRFRDLPALPAGRCFEPGTYRLVFQTGAYFAGRKIEPFFPHVEVVFTVADPLRHYHVPLLISPFGYTTYRGS